MLVGIRYTIAYTGKIYSRNRRIEVYSEFLAIVVIVIVIYESSKYLRAAKNNFVFFLKIINITFN